MQDQIYITATGGHFAAAPVTVRKYPADLNQTREVRFAPVASDGERAVTVMRHLVSRDVTLAYLAAKDDKARAAIIAAIPATAILAVKSAISPTREQVALMRALVAREVAQPLAAAGVLIIPSTRGDKSAEGKASKAKMSAEAKADAAFDLMFAEPVESESDDTANAESVAAAVEQDRELGATAIARGATLPEVPAE